MNNTERERRSRYEGGVLVGLAALLIVAAVLLSGEEKALVAFQDAIVGLAVAMAFAGFLLLFKWGRLWQK